MNQVKMKYAQQRLNAICAEKVSAVPQVVHEDTLAFDEVLKRLRNGTATINWNTVGKSRDRWGHHRSVSNNLEQQVIGKENAAIERRNAALNRGRDRAQAKIRATARKIEDELVLGDEAKAMALLEKFAAS